MIKVTGNTYPARKILKDSDFEWVPQYKAWFGTEENKKELDRITRPSYSRTNQKAATGLQFETVDSYK